MSDPARSLEKSPVALTHLCTACFKRDELELLCRLFSCGLIQQPLCGVGKSKQCLGSAFRTSLELVEMIQSKTVSS